MRAVVRDSPCRISSISGAAGASANDDTSRAWASGSAVAARRANSAGRSCSDVATA
jgi:hypothetical protein